MGKASSGDGPSANGGARLGVVAGGDPLSREQVREHQRARIMGATVAMVAERGFRDASIARVTEAAGVSRHTFYELFESFEECFLAVLDGAMRRSTALIAEAFARSDTWPERAVGGLGALLGFLDSDPGLARVCLVEALAAGRAALEYRARELEVIKHMVDGAASDGRVGGGASMHGAETIVAAVAGILHGRVVKGEAPPFMDLLEQLVEVALGSDFDREGVAPQIERARLSADVAAQERGERAGAEVAIPRGLSNPAAYQARSCLLYVVAHPGASNGAVGEGTGVRHRAQISSVLGRLVGLGLVTKRAGGPGRANAWTATPAGERVARALGDGLWR